MGRREPPRSYTAAQRALWAPDLRADTFGTSNPTVMNKPFWKQMIFAENPGRDPVDVLVGFDLKPTRDSRQPPIDEELPPVLRATAADLVHKPGQSLSIAENAHRTGRVPTWTNSRTGQAKLRLPDGSGRVLEIAGAWGSHDDADFHIYNDVILYTPRAECGGLHLPSEYDVTIYGYPRDVFSPTFFHKATYCQTSEGNKSVFIIGGVPFVSDVCQVWRLDLSDFSIQKMGTTGEAPLSHDGGRVKGTMRDRDHMLWSSPYRKAEMVGSDIVYTQGYRFQYRLSVPGMRWPRVPPERAITPARPQCARSEAGASEVDGSEHSTTAGW